MLVVIILMVFSINLLAEQTTPEKSEKNNSEHAEKAQAPTHNFEIIIQKNDETEITSWTGQIFSIVNGKSVENVSPKKRNKRLPAGNYLLMLHFDKDIPEIQGHRPFTFSIAEDAKTTFTLVIGASQEPEIEYGVVRTGADFIASDSRRGRDYVNFELPEENPELCLARCKKDPNCDIYSYVKSPEMSKPRCWLIHGAAVPREDPYAVSGVVQRNASPYQVKITTEKFESKK